MSRNVDFLKKIAYENFIILSNFNVMQLDNANLKILMMHF